MRRARLSWSWQIPAAEFAASKHEVGWRGSRRKTAFVSEPCYGNLSIAITPPVDLIKGWGPGDIGLGALFQHGNCSLPSPPPMNCLFKCAFSEVLAVWRVAENELERLNRTDLAELGCVSAPDLGRA